jgi:hypothetical protein
MVGRSVPDRRGRSVPDRRVRKSSLIRKQVVIVKIHVGPIFRFGNQSSTYRVIANIFYLLAKTFV